MGDWLGYKSPAQMEVGRALDWSFGLVVGVWIGIGFVDTRWILDCRRRRLLYITI